MHSLYFPRFFFALHLREKRRLGGQNPSVLASLGPRRGVGVRGEPMAREVYDGKESCCALDESVGVAHCLPRGADPHIKVTRIGARGSPHPRHAGGGEVPRRALPGDEG